jgi:hypothetical protein
MSTQRRRYNVGVVKIPYADRDVARDVLGATGTERGFFDILGADTDDDDERFPVGADCAYTVDLTEAEADRFRAASNCRYVTLDEAKGYPCSPINVPEQHTKAWLGQVFDGSDDWHGRNINVAILDTGTTPALRSYMGYTLVARGYANVADPPPANSTYPEAEHGSYVSSAAIPAGGRMLDYNIAGPDSLATQSWMAAGIRWGCDNGAKVMNMSHGFTSSSGMAPVQDALNYMAGFDTVLFCSAGNTAGAFQYPAAFCFSYPYVHGVMSFDESTGQLAPTSCYTTNRNAGVSPGNPILGVGPDGVERLWYGTSAASPAAASCAVRMLTKGTITAHQASTALKQNFRNLGLPYQGGGGYDMKRALDGLDAFAAKAIAAAGGWLVFL